MKLRMSPYTAYAIYGAAGVQLAGSVVGGLLLGGLADKRFGTGPWLTAAGLVLGFAGGMVNLIRITKWFEGRKNKKGEGDGCDG